MNTPDLWECTLVDVNDQPLIYCEAILLACQYTDSSLCDYAMVEIITPRCYAVADGVAHTLLVTKNKRLIARDSASYENKKYVVTTGDHYPSGRVVLTSKDMIRNHVKQEPVCTCGGWAVYGRDADIHSDTVAFQCDLRRVK